MLTDVEAAVLATVVAVEVMETCAKEGNFPATFNVDIAEIVSRLLFKQLELQVPEPKPRWRTHEEVIKEFGFTFFAGVAGPHIWLGAVPFSDTGLYFFWDEAEAQCLGPFDTMMDVTGAMADYARRL